MKWSLQYLFISVLLVGNFCRGMDSSSTSQIESDDELFLHLNHPTMQNTTNTAALIYPDNLSDQLKKKLEEAFQDLPNDLANSIMAFKKTYERGMDTNHLINILIFTGEPGTGKSTAAKAIAYKLGWPYLYIDCASLGDSYQNSAIVHIREMVQPLIATNKPCIIIFDEISSISKQAKDVRDENSEMHKIRHEINALLDQIEDKKIFLL